LNDAAAPLVLLPNLGGEEGDGWRRAAEEPAVATAASLWASLFGRHARLDERRASPHPDPAFEWLPTAGGALAWWGDPDAAAELAGHRWLGPAPEVVLRVHDKAFALEHGSTPTALRGLARVFDARELADVEATLATIEATVRAWPAPMRAQYCLKPRQGSSGRGRVVGRGDPFEATGLRGSLSRLARRGGAILEPWLERRADLSVSFHLGDGASGPPLELLGSLCAISTPGGVPRGHRGELDRRGRVYSGSPFEDTLRSAGSDLALCAWEAGLRGPCGVDALVYRDAEQGDVLRPTVELNARFTMGIVALGCLRRARARLREALDIAPDERVGVLVATREAPRDWADFGVDLVLPIETTSAADGRRRHGPAILAARDPARLDAVAQMLASTPTEGSRRAL
jgi:hypothetical protein